VRYSSPMISGKAIFLDNDQIDVSLNEASTEISPGQVGVLYKDEICLGGGIIV
jgi:tRNA U34 2-thiouridine synthase MnmA/TrmU